MKCPGCGGELATVSVTGFDDSNRCRSCGGLWVKAWVVNRIANGERILVNTSNPVPASEGDGRCPEDGTKLEYPTEAELPEELAEVKKCSKCGSWWLPGDTIWKLARSFLVKREYYATWKKKQPDWLAWAWPAAIALILGAGIWAGVRLVQMKPEIVTRAMEIFGK